MANLKLNAWHPRSDGNDKHFGDGVANFTPLGNNNDPKNKHHRPLHLEMTFGEWKTRGDPETIRIMEAANSSGDGGSKTATGLELRRYPLMDRKPMELVHHRRDDSVEDVTTVIAVIDKIPKSNERGSATIRCPQPRFEGQEQEQEQEVPVGEAPLFPWAVIKERPIKGLYYKYTAEVQMIRKEEAATEMKQADNVNAKDDNNNNVPRSSYRCEEVCGPAGPQTVIYKDSSVGAPPVAGHASDSDSDSNDSDPTSSSSSEPATAAAAAGIRDSFHARGTTTFRITVAPGIDPCLIVCIAADRMNRMNINVRKGREQNLIGGICGACFCS